SILVLILSLIVGQSYDIVILGGRVMDPETGLDAVRNVGINGDRIVEISEKALSGNQIINANGLVVAPGFIDLHAHGQSNDAHRYQARDGVTTALEMEVGVSFIREWISQKSGNSIVNFGGTAPHANLRALAMDGNAKLTKKIFRKVEEEGLNLNELAGFSKAFAASNYKPQTQKEINRTHQMMSEYLEAGALGIGVPIGYYLGATAGEIFQVYEFAASMDVPVYTHTRGFGLPGLQEAMADAGTAGASVHLVHANSMSLGEIETTLSMVESAQKNGLDITTEVYPYTAASTFLESALFDEGWKETLNISYEDIQWEATGERLNSQSFYEYRKKGGVVIIHMMKPAWIKQGVAHPVTMIASDGMPFAPGAHPRTAGTFSRVLGRYVRKERALDLMTALKKMTIMPAKRIEGVAPMMRHKGRLQVGADADITIFNPRTIIDKADFKGLQYSQGVEFVLVNGTLVVDKGENVPNKFPGKPILGKYRK
ncbi:MAG: amidohydrolase family protein, partial [Candidatus Marinimicrobia bacterium]|nr:amidohydrolase family protein [Candidatus Neomarinimicrobiota bacterium]MBT6638663.1 amidohydrolase family protein [Candidatus Neomarinimicrobiota bacterium]